MRTTVLHAGAVAAALTTATITAGAGAPIAWNAAADGVWSLAANWNPATVPGLSDDAVLGLKGAYTVNLGAVNAGVHHLTIANPNATLQINSARTLDVVGGAHNLGVIIVNPTTGQAAAILRVADGVTISGGGRITLNAPIARAQITPATPGAAFTQSSGHTINGYGQITAALTNNGLVSADVPSQGLVLTSSPLANNAQMQAVGGATLALTGATVTQAPSATITADGTGSAVQLNGAAVVGGTLRAVNGGVITVITGDSAIESLSLTGESQITSTRTLTATGNIAHTGRMLVNLTSGQSAGILRVADGVVFTGNGRITLNAPGARAQITPATPGAAFTQSPGHTIDGFGQVTAALTNNGLVSANVPSQGLILSTAPQTNNAQMRAVDGATLALIGTTVTQASGAAITADGAGSVVQLNGSTIVGGTLQAVNGGVITVLNADSAIHSITLAGDSQISTSRTLDVTGDVTHTGNMVVNPLVNLAASSLRVADGVTFTGNGRITLNAPGARAQIIPATSGATFTQAAGHTIAGYGQISASMINNGLVSADAPPQPLTISTAPQTNNARMQAVNGTTLALVGTTVTQGPSATITADGAGSVVQLNGATIAGGTLQAVNGGVISVINADATIDGLTLAGDCQILNGRTLSVTSDVTHAGHMVVNPAVNLAASSLRVTDGVTLTGNGRITLNAPGVRAQIIPDSAGAALNLGPGQRLEGIGLIGAQLNLDGTLAPGLPVGSMTASQPIILSDSAVFEAEIAANNAADLLSSTSTFHADGTLAVAFVNGFNPATYWSATVVTAGQGVTGAFDSIDAPQPADNRLEFRVIYGPTQIRIGAFCKGDTNADGLLNFFDISTFLTDFNEGSPNADIAAPFGALNFFDIAAFLDRYSQGCP